MDEAEKRRRHAERQRRWRAENPDKVREANRAYREANREKLLDYARKRLAESPEARERARDASRRHYAMHGKHHRPNAKSVSRDDLPNQTRGESHPNWKGDAAGYFAVHAWVVRQLGQPSECEHCGTTERRVYHWANRDHSYKRDLADWMRLCVSCHCKFDYANNNRTRTRRKRE